MSPSEEAQKLTTEDQPLFDAVKAEFGERCTDDLAIRVTRAFHGVKKNRLQFTLAETKKILDWRVASNVDSILTRELDLTKVYNECWPAYLYGEDSEGHVVTVDRVGEMNVDGFLKNFSHVSQLLPHRVQYMERIQWEKAAISTRLGRRVYKHVCVVDLKGLGMKHVSPSVLSQLKPIFDVGQLYYPETLQCLYIVNAPLIFYGAWKVISALIQPETREKIQVFVRKDAKTFTAAAQKHGIPLESLPKFLGGSHPGRLMDNTFTPCVPDTPLPAATNSAAEAKIAAVASATAALEVSKAS
ncbi:hypothetical protein BBJ28_00022701 [Nothophytophthora sp. Chile5]|nr:hypothetical protein BBJ28_00022701 [Nothophytophthora sp. Chile5]